MTDHPHEVPRRGSDCGRPRSVGDPDGAFDAGLPILRELERLVHDAAEPRSDTVDDAIDHSAITPDPDAATATVPSRSVRRNGTPAS